MPGTKKTKRKGKAVTVKRVPGVKWSNAHEVAMDRRKPMTQENKDLYITHAEDAYTLMIRGALGKHNWGILAGTLNLSEALIKIGIGRNLLDANMRAQDALLAIGQRLNANGQVTCWGLEIGVMREALDYFALQLDLCTNGEFDKAVDMANTVKKLHDTRYVIDHPASTPPPAQ